jgi:hypothetical protein
LRAVGHVSPALLDALVSYPADGNQFAAERLAREPGWVLDAALRESDSKVFAAHLSRVDGHEVASLTLGQESEALYERALVMPRTRLCRFDCAGDIGKAIRIRASTREAGKTGGVQHAAGRGAGSWFGAVCATRC